MIDYVVKTGNLKRDRLYHIVLYENNVDNSIFGLYTLSTDSCLRLCSAGVCVRVEYG